MKAEWSNKDSLEMPTTTSDYINREDAIEMVLEPLNNMPSADVVEVVRCKDCKWVGMDEHCPAIEVYMICGDNGYCSYGERKEE